MKTTTFLTIAAVATGILAAAPAPADAKSMTPLARSCAFVADMKSSEFGVQEALVRLFENSKDEGIANAGQQLQAILSKTTIEDGKVFRIAQLGDAMEEHLIAFGSKGRGVEYFRVIYEESGNGLKALKFNFQSQYHDILGVWPILQEPVALECAS